MFALCDASSGVFQPQDNECHMRMPHVGLIFFRCKPPSLVVLQTEDREVRLQQRLFLMELHFLCPQDWGLDPLVDDV